MTNIDITYNAYIDDTERDKVTRYKCLGQTIAKDNGARCSDKNKGRIERSWKVQRNLTRQAPFHRSEKKDLQRLCFSTVEYGCQTWSLTTA